MSAGAAVFGSAAIGAGSAAGKLVEREADVSVTEYNSLDRGTISADRSLVRNHPVVSKFEEHFAAYDLEYKSASGFSVLTDDAAINAANPRLVMLGYAEEGPSVDRAGQVEISGNSGAILAQLEDHEGDGRVVSAAPFIAEEQPTAATRTDRTYQIKTLEQRGRRVDALVSDADTARFLDLKEQTQDHITVSTDALARDTGSDIGTDSVGDLIDYICAGTCTPMVLYICENSTGNVGKRTCVSACFRFVTNPWLLGACGGACLILIDFINDKGCAAGAGTICAAFCSQAT